MLFWLQAGARLRSPVFLLPLIPPLLALQGNSETVGAFSFLGLQKEREDGGLLVELGSFEH